MTADNERILIVRLSAHGDVVQTLPLLAALKRNAPNRVVGWLVEESAAELLMEHPLIDRLHVSRRKTWLRSLRNPLRWLTVLAEVVGFVRELREAGYTISLDVQGLLKSALWPVVAGIPRRCGNDRAREGASVFYNLKLPPHPITEQHVSAISRYLDFARVVDPSDPAIAAEAVRFPLPQLNPADFRQVDAWLGKLDRQRPTIAMAPATVWPSKHWRPQHWTRLINQLAPASNLVFIGHRHDNALIRQVAGSVLDQPNTLNLAGQTTLRDLYALFHHVDVFIGPDSAPLHLANAVANRLDNPNEKPFVIGLFGPTAPGRTGPVPSGQTGQQHQALNTKLPCQPCFERHCPLKTHACMRELMPDQVLAAVNHLMERESERESRPA